MRGPISTEPINVMNRWITVFVCLVAVSCRQNDHPGTSTATRQSVVRIPDPRSLALVPHTGSGRVDREIIRLQNDVRAEKNVDASVERLGWAFVAKARESFDAGYYKLAEQCALVLDSRQPHGLEAMLLRGHVLHNLHRFREAEPMARELVASRGLPFDFGLLSDVLMEQGKLDEAIAACQKMVDLRPDLHSYARGAHLRWLRGNVEGAEKLMHLAADSASPHDSESAAWVNTRLAGYEFQLGDWSAAERSCALALEFQKDYPPALLLIGRLLLAQQKNAEAADALQRAVKLNPLPEYQWALLEALRADRRLEEAARVETQLRQTGATADPRTFSIYLATHGESVEAALRLAEAELNSRADVFTHDAVAWSFAASGKFPEAQQQMALALAEGTQDARLFFHAGMIAHKSGDQSGAQRFIDRTRKLEHLLLPSEREQLYRITVPTAQAVVTASGMDINKQKMK